MTSSEHIMPSLLVGKGQVIQADYRDPIISSYRDNPLIEALPPILTEDEVMELLTHYPNYDPQERQLPSHLRLHLIQNALQFFAPLPVHLDLEQRFSRMIRLGYQARNPADPAFWGNLHTKVQSMGRLRGHVRSTATGFTILGISGVGKTSAVEAILSLYPQVILHTEYQQRELSFTQIVWLKLDCPFDGSIKGLCLNFFQAVDDLLGSRYYENYASGRPTVDTLLPRMALVASTHSIGVLVIDEIQHLSEAKSGGSKKMLNFFVQLINTIGLPVILVGTYKAMSLLSGEFRQTRRGTGQGDLVWDRMAQDDIWQLFLESLWTYQYIRQPTKLTPSLSKALYEATQGITDFAVKVYMLAQVRAISNGKETLNARMIRSVAEGSLRLAEPILTALRTGDKRVLYSVEDVYPIDLTSYLEEAQRIAAQSARFVESPAPDLTERLVALPPETTQPEAKKPPRKRRSPKAKATTSTSETSPSSLPADSLLSIVAAGEQENLTAYEALKQAGYIQSVDEYL
ncbi:MAG: ATP-binding protein [Cyanobacteria bacterium P01_H01_bin.153]